MKKLYFVIVLLAVATGSFAQNTSLHDKVWQRVLALNKAVFETKDSIAINELVATEVTYGHSGGNLENKSIMLHNAVANVEVYKNISIEKLSIGNAGNAVVARYILRADAIKNGVTNALNIGIMQVWAKSKGKWVLFARQAVKVSPK